MAKRSFLQRENNGFQEGGDGEVEEDEEEGLLEAEEEEGEEEGDEEDGEEEEEEDDEEEEEEDEEEEEILNRRSRILVTVIIGGRKEEVSRPRVPRPLEPHRIRGEVGCQVDGCVADLGEAKRYHRRHKVCESHAKATVVSLCGVDQRYCQQCSRFHELLQFDGAKRSCRKRLAGHNERRRKIPHDPQAEDSREELAVSPETDKLLRPSG